jgi:hypothetical protein
MKENQKKASPEYQIYNTLWHRRVKDGKVEYFLMPATVRPLDDQTGEILKLIKLWREGKEKSGQPSRNSQVKKRAAPLSKPRMSSRPKKPRQL